MKVTYILLLCMLQSLGGWAQWSKDRAGDMTYHCAGCVGIADMVFTPHSIAMEGVSGADITICDSLGQPLEEWRSVPFNMVYDTAATTTLHRFVTRRQGHLEMLVYRPSSAWPQREETFTYIIPTVKTEKIEKILLTY